MADYIKNNWTSYDPNIPDDQQPDSFLTKEKLDHMEEGIFNAFKSGGSSVIEQGIEIGEVTEGDEAHVEVVDGKLNMTLPRGPKGEAGVAGPAGKDGVEGRGVYVCRAEVTTTEVQLTDIESPAGVKVNDAIIDIAGNVFCIVAVDETIATVGTKIFSLKGAKGDKGDQGEPGLQGPKGEPGEPGKDGIQGPQGIPGAEGAQGIQGAKGEKGDKGDQGIQGPAGAQGEVGPKGDKGDPGAQGPKGDKGDPGTSIVIKGSKPSEDELPTEGNEAGDGWVVNGDLYIWDAENSKFVNVGKIQGPKGDKGEKGEQGDPGIQGPEGPAGKDGAEGAQGIQGPKGDQGEPGVTGPAGKDGAAGAEGKSAYQVWVAAGNEGDETAFLASLKGEKGDQGPAGTQGEPGPQGPRGEVGAQGIQGPKGDKGDPGVAGPAGKDGEAGKRGTWIWKCNKTVDKESEDEMGIEVLYSDIYLNTYTKEDVLNGDLLLDKDGNLFKVQGSGSKPGSPDRIHYAMVTNYDMNIIGKQGEPGPAGPKGDKGDPGVGLVGEATVIAELAEGDLSDPAKVGAKLNEVIAALKARGVFTDPTA